MKKSALKYHRVKFAARAVISCSVVYDVLQAFDAHGLQASVPAKQSQQGIEAWKRFANDNRLFLKTDVKQSDVTRCIEVVKFLWTPDVDETDFETLSRMFSEQASRGTGSFYFSFVNVCKHWFKLANG